MDDKDETDYYEHQLAMFETRGWKFFEEQVREMRAATDTLKDVKVEDVRFRQGELSIIDWILGWPNAMRVAYNSKTPEAETPEN